MLFLDTIPPTGKPVICDDKDTMKCDNGRHCYGREEQCNGYNDCDDGTDERNCAKPTRSSTTRKSIWCLVTSPYCVCLFDHICLQ